MTDLRPLTLLLDHSERERDAGLAAHRRAHAVSLAAAAQAAQLRDYRREYEARWRTQFGGGNGDGGGGQIDLLRCSHSFMARLTEAVDQQTAIAAHNAAQAAAALIALQSVELRCASVRKLIERRLRDDQLAGTRRDQKQSDEYASRVAWGRRAVAGQPGWI